MIWREDRIVDFDCFLDELFRDYCVSHIPFGILRVRPTNRACGAGMFPILDATSSSFSLWIEFLRELLRSSSRFRTSSCLMDSNPSLLHSLRSTLWRLLIFFNPPCCIFFVLMVIDTWNFDIVNLCNAIPLDASRIFIFQVFNNLPIAIFTFLIVR